MDFFNKEKKETNKCWTILMIIIIIGVFGNIINTIVLSNKTMRKNSTFKYLFYLAIIDLLVLSIGASDALMTYGHFIIIRLYSNTTCRLHTFLTYFLTHMSSIILMIVSIDRVLVVCNNPTQRTDKSKKLKLSQRLRIKRKSSALTHLIDNFMIDIDFYRRFNVFKKVNKIVIILMIILTLANLHYLVFLRLNSADYNEKLDFRHLKKNKDQKLHNYTDDSKLDAVQFFNQSIKNGNLILNRYNITAHPESLLIDISNETSVFMCYPLQTEKYNYFLLNVWLWIDALIYSLIPFLVMLICSIIIIVEIRSKSNSFIQSNLNSNPLICKKTKRRNRQLLIMLLFNNFYFVICSLPLCLSMFYYKYMGQQLETHSFQTFFHILAYSNNSFNFVFYFIFSHKYRQVFFRYLFCRESKRNSIFSNNRNTTLGMKKSISIFSNKNTNVAIKKNNSNLQRQNAMPGPKPNRSNSLFSEKNRKLSVNFYFSPINGNNHNENNLIMLTQNFSDLNELRLVKSTEVEFL